MMWKLLCLQEAFFYLALTNTRRVSRLASSPEALACWALEIVKEAAESALKFVQDYDTSALGLGQVLEGSVSEDQVGLGFGDWDLGCCVSGFRHQITNAVAMVCGL
jgi:hypothetical protein